MKYNTQNAKIASIKEETLVLGIEDRKSVV